MEQGVIEKNSAWTELGVFLRRRNLSKVLALSESEIRFLGSDAPGDDYGGFVAANIEGRSYLVVAVDNGWYATRDGEIGEDGEVLRDATGIDWIETTIIDLESGSAHHWDDAIDEGHVHGIVYAARAHLEEPGDQFYLDYFQSHLAEKIYILNKNRAHSTPDLSVVDRDIRKAGELIGVTL